MKTCAPVYFDTLKVKIKVIFGDLKLIMCPAFAWSCNMDIFLNLSNIGRR